MAITNGEATCRCGETFVPRAVGGKPQKYCSQLCRKRHHAAAWYASHPGYNRKYYLANRLTARAANLRKFGLTVEQYENLLAAQTGVCAICEQDCSSGRRLAVDHDHQTGRVRGLLCGKCNQALGLFSDSTERLTKAARYLGNR